MGEKKTVEERLESIEQQIAAVKVGWLVLKWIGYIAGALWAAFVGFEAAQK